jgi:hypothetical protein
MSDTTTQSVLFPALISKLGTGLEYLGRRLLNRMLISVVRKTQLILPIRPPPGTTIKSCCVVIYGKNAWLMNTSPPIMTCSRM